MFLSSYSRSFLNLLTKLLVSKGSTAATPGDGTSNTVAGVSTVNGAAIVITNNQVKADSLILATIAEPVVDANMTSVQASTTKAFQNGASRACKAITFSGASGAFTIGETITESVSLATGVLEAIEVTAGAGTMILSSAGAFTGGHVLTGGTSGKTANGLVVSTGYKAVDYDGQVMNFAIGAVITDLFTGATGTLVAQNDAGATGTLGLLTAGTWSDNDPLADNSGMFRLVANAAPAGLVRVAWLVAT